MSTRKRTGVDGYDWGMVTNRRADFFYVDLQKTRNEYGLGEFNNETPALIKRDYSKE